MGLDITEIEYLLHDLIGNEDILSDDPDADPNYQPQKHLLEVSSDEEEKKVRVYMQPPAEAADGGTDVGSDERACSVNHLSRRLLGRK